MISKAPKRWIPRLIHLIFSIPIVGYVYSPFKELPNYAPWFGLSPFLYLSLRDFGCGKAMSCDDLFRKDRSNQGQFPSRHSDYKGTSMKGVGTKKELSPKEREELLKALKARFEKNMDRHNGLEEAKVQATLEANPEKLWSLGEMEKTGGEPYVVGHGKKTGEYIFLIVRRKVLKAAEASVTTERRGSHATLSFLI
jgi:hypothetical protein